MHLKCPWCAAPQFGDWSNEADQNIFFAHVKTEHPERNIYTCEHCVNFISTQKKTILITIKLNINHHRVLGRFSE